MARVHLEANRANSSNAALHAWASASRRLYEIGRPVLGRRRQPRAGGTL